MFDWLNRKRRNEQKKLFYQNFTAVIYFIGYDPTGPYEEIQNELKQIRKRCKDEGTLASWQDSERLLEINQYLRKMHDESVNGLIKSFDEEYKPLLGWKEYFSRDL